MIPAVPGCVAPTEESAVGILVAIRVPGTRGIAGCGRAGAWDVAHNRAAESAREWVMMMIAIMAG